MLKRSVLWVALALGIAATGCDEKFFDCVDICSTIQSCILVDINLSACTDRCDDFAKVNDAQSNQVQACNDCLDTRSCSSGIECSDLCAFLIN